MVRRWARVWCFAVVMALAAPAAAEEEPPTGKHCLGETCPKLVMHHVFGGRINTTGVENTVEIGPCLPLIRKPGILFDYTNVSFGFVNVLSPTYSNFGGYLEIAPLSFLVFHAQAGVQLLWPLGLDRTGYHVRSGYDDEYSHAALPGEDGEGAVGWYALAGGTLQIKIPLGPLGLIVLDTFSVEFWQLGAEDYYYNCKKDVVLARRDLLIDNSAMVLLEVPLHRNFALRTGGLDDWIYVPASKHVDHRIYGVLGFNFSRLGRAAHDFMPFVAVGGVLRHGFLEGQATMLLGFMTDYQLVPRPGPR
jgi:hypothetical protein